MVNTSIDILPPLYRDLKSSSASRSRLLKRVELQEHHTVAICASQQRFAIAPGHTARILCQTVKPNRMMMLIIVA